MIFIKDGAGHTCLAPTALVAGAGEVTPEQIESCALAAGFSIEPSTGAIWAVDGNVGTRVDPGLHKFARAIHALRQLLPRQQAAPNLTVTLSSPQDAVLATRLWNSREEWACPADIARVLAIHKKASDSESMTEAAQDVLAERQRQINVKWYTPGHDSEHGDGSLARAAACYAMGKQTVRAFEGAPDVILWPWENASWKPTTHRRNLIKAGALILAEIERLDRADGITAKTEGI